MTSSSVLCLCFLCSSVCFRNVGCWHVPVLGGPAFALVLQIKGISPNSGGVPKEPTPKLFKL